MKTKVGTIEEQYTHAQGKRTFYLIIVTMMLILPIIGYITESGVQFPTGKTLWYFPLNYGAYGFAGFVVVYLFVAVICGFIGAYCAFRSLGFLWGLILMVPVFALILGVAVGIIEVFYSSCCDAIVRWLSENVSGKSIPGISKTLGVALLCSVMYDIPLALFLWRLVVQWKRCTHLKTLAAEEKAARELREQQVAEERARQKQIQRTRKEQEKKEREEYERTILKLDREAKADHTLGEYSFFDGCATLEHAESVYSKLMDVYNPTDGTGDPALARVIKEQYEKLKEKFNVQSDKAF